MKINNATHSKPVENQFTFESLDVVEVKALSSQTTAFNEASLKLAVPKGSRAEPLPTKFSANKPLIGPHQDRTVDLCHWQKIPLKITRAVLHNSSTVISGDFDILSIHLDPPVPNPTSRTFSPTQTLHKLVKMPPKKVEKQGGAKKPSASKIVEDRTFGMKNKKGAQAQKVISQMKTSAKAGGTPEEKKKEAEKAQREREKAASEAAKREAAEMFKPLQVQKVPFGVDPKTVLCQFYKKGHCEKGRKCKFSHDLNVERKSEKKDLYQDTREEEEAKKKAETSEDWDEEKLKSVVLSKKGNQKATTDKVCKFFIEAIEDGKYGWFWTCPNGGDKCMYQHKLPPGSVLLFSSLTDYTDMQQIRPENERTTRGGEGPPG